MTVGKMDKVEERFNFKSEKDYRCEAELDKFLGSTGHEEELQLQRLLYPLYSFKNTRGETVIRICTVKGKPRTLIAGAIYYDSKAFSNSCTRFGGDLADVIALVAVKVTELLYGYKYRGLDLTNKPYSYLKRAITNYITDLKRRYLADKNVMERDTLLAITEEQFTRAINKATLEGRYVSNVRSRSTEDIDNEITIQQMLADKSLTDKERNLMQVKLDYPLATLTELAELAGYTNKMAVSRAFKTIANKLQDFKPAIF